MKSRTQVTSENTRFAVCISPVKVIYGSLFWKQKLSASLITKYCMTLHLLWLDIKPTLWTNR